MPCIPFRQWRPKVAASTFVAPTAWVTGDVTVGEKVSIFFGATLRGDILPVSVGAGSNIQENALLHTSQRLTPCVVGEHVTIGHSAIVHGCTVEEHCIIGMGSVILDGARVGRYSIVGAQALVPMNMVIPEGSLVVGVPAKVVRSLTEAEREQIRESAHHYIEVGAEYRSHFDEQRRGER